MSETIKHVGPHKYIRVKTPKDTYIFRCGIARCPRYLLPFTIVGQEALCWRCGKAFTIVKRTLRNKYLHCVDCTKAKTAETALIDDGLLNELLKGSESLFESEDLK